MCLKLTKPIKVLMEPVECYVIRQYCTKTSKIHSVFQTWFTWILGKKYTAYHGCENHPVIALCVGEMIEDSMFHAFANKEQAVAFYNHAVYERYWGSWMEPIQLYLASGSGLMAIGELFNFSHSFDGQDALCFSELTLVRQLTEEELCV